MSEAPSLIVIAGPNGAGKSTAAADLLAGAFGVDEFVNADVIARGISAFHPEEAAFEAGRITLDRLRCLTAERASVAFEATMAARTLAPWVKSLTATGYVFRIMFLWLPTADMAVKRVSRRVQEGGHHVPEAVIRRRYEAGLRNFFRIYSSLAETWSFYDNSVRGPRPFVAGGAFRETTLVLDPGLWNNIKGVWG
jgi:predicted ABC-type ATPase